MHRAGIQRQAGDALLRWPTTVNENTPLQYYILVLATPYYTGLDGRPSILINTDGKNSWRTEVVSTDETEVLTMRWKDTGNTDKSTTSELELFQRYYKLLTFRILTVQIPPLCSLPTNRIMSILIKYHHRSVNRVLSICTTVMASLFNSQKSTVPYKTLYTLSSCPGFTPFAISHLSRWPERTTLNTTRYMRSSIVLIWPMTFIQRYWSTDRVPH